MTCSYGLWPLITGGVIGLWIGASVGFLLQGILSAGRMADEEAEAAYRADTLNNDRNAFR